MRGNKLDRLPQWWYVQSTPSAEGRAREASQQRDGRDVSGGDALPRSLGFGSGRQQWRFGPGPRRWPCGRLAPKRKAAKLEAAAGYLPDRRSCQPPAGGREPRDRQRYEAVTHRVWEVRV